MSVAIVPMTEAQKVTHLSARVHALCDALTVARIERDTAKAENRSLAAQVVELSRANRRQAEALEGAYDANEAMHAEKANALREVEHLRFELTQARKKAAR